jgi:hypothetical protein
MVTTLAGRPHAGIRARRRISPQPAAQERRSPASQTATSLPSDAGDAATSVARSVSNAVSMSMAWVRIVRCLSMDANE